jgi:hypothetical protein
MRVQHIEARHLKQRLSARAGSTAEAHVQSNGLTMNGLTMNGLTMNGLTMNGLTSNGLTMNGLTPTVNDCSHCDSFALRNALQELGSKSLIASGP